ncbi:MAG TPA: SHOCT domain-containing protein [Ilumatobacteraceae bacterium]|nr:SHOCT domain-containing protein [Ilumatobacteraceae bacterium]
MVVVFVILGGLLICAPLAAVLYYLFDLNKRQHEKIDLRRQQLVANSSPVRDVQPIESIADQLLRLEALRDRGALTEAEFATAKSKLLA